LPRLLMRPWIVGSPADICFGTKPSQGAKSHPLVNAAPLAMAATMALAMIGSLGQQLPEILMARVIEGPQRRLAASRRVHTACHRRDGSAQTLIVHGGEAGGHNRASAAKFPLLPAMIDAIDSIPIVAARGIAESCRAGARCRGSRLVASLRDQRAAGVQGSRALMSFMFGVSRETTRIAAFLDEPKLLGFAENIPMFITFAIINIRNTQGQSSNRHRCVTARRRNYDSLLLVHCSSVYYAFA
jgi:hypothetical protein